MSIRTVGATLTADVIVWGGEAPGLLKQFGRATMCVYNTGQLTLREGTE